jgi:hypothetical protein
VRALVIQNVLYLESLFIISSDVFQSYGLGMLSYTYIVILYS